MKIQKETAARQISFQAYAVRIGIRSSRKDYLIEISERLDKILPNGFEFIEDAAVEHVFEIEHDRADGFQIFRNGEMLAAGKDERDFLALLESHLRLTVAEFAVDTVFLHAGVVGWKGRALIIPASSFAGKTTLVAELIRNGAVYYSDEYAVIGADGLVYPYPKMLSLRGIIDDYRQFDVAAERLGGKIGIEPIPAGMILISRFDRGVKDAPADFETLTAGQGMIEVLAHPISIRHNPKLVLKVLNKILTRAIIAKIQRGEAKIFVPQLIDYLDTEFAAIP